MTAEATDSPKMREDPRSKGRQPPFREPSQPAPGHSSEMKNQPDYGEQSYRGYGRLQGKKAVITGGDSGIDRAVALAYAREGADVLISYLNEDEDARETARLVTEAGRKAITMAGDIGRPQHAEEIVNRAFRELGGLDILVNNAAQQATHESIEEVSPEEWDSTFRTNIHAMFYAARSALPRMPAGGAVINTTSVQAYQPSPTLLAYASTKGAIVTFTKSLAQLAIKRGVRVNAVAPGPVWTPLIPSGLPKSAVKKFGEEHLYERPAQPAELAPTYVFLASEESRYVTGAVFDLTGGSLLP